MALEATGFREELKEIILLSSHVLAGTLLSTFTLSLKTCSTREDTQASQDDSRYSLVRSRSIAASTISKVQSTKWSLSICYQPNNVAFLNLINFCLISEAKVF